MCGCAALGLTEEETQNRLWKLALCCGPYPPGFCKSACGQSHSDGGLTSTMRGVYALFTEH